MLRDNPLLTLLGRKGRAAVVDALRQDAERTWTVRDLARAADVPVITASRTVRELDALGVVDAFRPGRNKHIRWEPQSAVARALTPFVVPDLRTESVVAFAEAFSLAARTGLVQWLQPTDDTADPLCPTRLAILIPDTVDEDDVLDAIGPALDAVADAGWPRPEVTTHLASELDDADDEIARAVRTGRPVS